MPQPDRIPIPEARAHPEPEIVEPVPALDFLLCKHIGSEPESQIILARARLEPDNQSPRQKNLSPKPGPMLRVKWYNSKPVKI